MVPSNGASAITEAEMLRVNRRATIHVYGFDSSGDTRIIQALANSRSDYINIGHVDENVNDFLLPSAVIDSFIEILNE